MEMITADSFREFYGEYLNILLDSLETDDYADTIVNGFFFGYSHSIYTGNGISESRLKRSRNQVWCDTLTYELSPIFSKGVQECIKNGATFNWNLRCNFLLYNGHSRDSNLVKQCIENGAKIDELYFTLRNSLVEVVQHYFRIYCSNFLKINYARNIICSDINVFQHFVQFLKSTNITNKYLLFEAVKIAVSQIDSLLSNKVIYFSYDENSYREIVEYRGFTSLNEHNYAVDSDDYYEEFAITDGKYNFYTDYIKNVNSIAAAAA